MRGVLPAAIALTFQGLLYIGLLRNVVMGVGVEASPNTVKRSVWNNLVPRGAWHEVVRRQTSSGNRTKDMYDFFTPDQPPAPCGIECEIIWGAASVCDTRSCTCTEPNGRQFQRCCNCLVTPNPTDERKDYYQGILTEFQSDYCKGYGVPRLTLQVGSAPSDVSPPDVTPANSPAEPTGLSLPVPSVTSDARGISISRGMAMAILLLCVASFDATL